MSQEVAVSEQTAPSPLKQLDGLFIEHPAFMNTLSNILFELSLQDELAEPPCFYVTGPTGIGKSTLIASLLEHYPRVVDDVRTVMPDGTVRVSDRVPMVSTTMRPQPTANGLLRSMLKELGDQGWKSGEREELQNRLALQARACKTRTIIVDEAQRAVDRDGVLRRYDIAEVLRDINESTGITIILFGMGRTRHLFDHDSQIWRRFEDEIVVPPFEWGEDNESGVVPECRQCFIGLLVTYRDQMALPFAASVDVEDQDVAMRFFYVSRGVVGLLKKLLLRAVKIALRQQSGEITEAILNEAFDRAFHKDVKAEALVNPWGPLWNRQVPAPLLHRDEIVKPKRRTRKPGTRSNRSRKSDRRAEVLQALTLR